MADDERLVFNLSSGGDVVIKLRPDLAPGHVERIKELTRSGFYDGVPFHRVISGFMAQGGDPSGRGTGGSDLPNLKAEFSREPHVRGVCSMARTQDPNSANSQFFICFDDARFLDNQYTVWGEVESGMEHVDLIARFLKVAHESGDRAGLGQIDFDRPGIAKLGNERVEAVPAARRKDQPMAFARKLPRELDTEACRGPRDQRDSGHLRQPA